MCSRRVARRYPRVLARQRALISPPGDQYSYSNTAYMLLSQIVERAGGQSLGEITEERISEPLGMEGILLPSYGPEPAYDGLTIAEIAEIRGSDPETTLMELLKADADTVADRATPEAPHAPSVGIEKVWVNGQLVFDGGQVTGNRPGKPLRRPIPRVLAKEPLWQNPGNNSSKRTRSS